jgi:hypothetical protein
MTSGKTISKRPVQRRVFTVEEANATLPLVRAIVADLVSLSREVVERRSRLSMLLPGAEPSRHDPFREELSQIEEEVEKDSRRLREYVAELRALGVEPTNTDEGVVDFPAVIDDRKIFLCWKLGEPRVAYWHEHGAGDRNRRPLAGLQKRADRVE